LKIEERKRSFLEGRGIRRERPRALRIEVMEEQERGSFEDRG
jgi:hypothetical protein